MAEKRRFTDPGSVDEEHDGGNVVCKGSSEGEIIEFELLGKEKEPKQLTRIKDIPFLAKA